MMEVINRIGDMLGNAQSFYLFLAVVGSVIFVVQFVMSFFGADFAGHSDVGSLDSTDTAGFTDHADITGINFFTLKSIVAFITFFGWAGVLWGKGWGGFFLAFGCGFLMMFMTALVIWLLVKLQQSGNVAAESLVGCAGVVYLKIPAGRKGGGRVTVKLPSCTREVNAVADEELATGMPVRVLELLAPDCYLVGRA